MALEMYSGLYECFMYRIKKMKKKCIDKSNDAQELQAIFKGPDAWTLQGVEPR